MPKREILSVIILDGQNLPAMDLDGKSDPYVKVSHNFLVFVYVVIDLNHFFRFPFDQKVQSTEQYVKVIV